MATSTTHVLKGNTESIWQELLLIVQGAGYPIIDTNEQNKQIIYEAGGGGFAWAQVIKIDLSQMGEGSTLVSFLADSDQYAVGEGSKQKELIQFMVDQISQKFPIDHSQVRNIPNAPGAGCFAKDSKIQSSFGEISISDLTPGDLVWSFNERTNSLNLRRVIKCLKHKPQVIYNIQLSDSDKTIRTTANHRFLCGTKWTKAKDLDTGSTLIKLDADGYLKKTRVLQTCSTGIVEPVYNIYTEYDCNFVVENVVAHNFSYCLELRVFLEKSCFSPRRKSIYPSGIPLPSSSFGVRI